MFNLPSEPDWFYAIFTGSELNGFRRNALGYIIYSTVSRSRPQNTNMVAIQIVLVWVYYFYAVAVRQLRKLYSS